MEKDDEKCVECNEYLQIVKTVYSGEEGIRRWLRALYFMDQQANRAGETQSRIWSTILTLSLTALGWAVWAGLQTLLTQPVKP